MSAISEETYQKKEKETSDASPSFLGVSYWLFHQVNESTMKTNCTLDRHLRKSPLDQKPKK